MFQITRYVHNYWFNLFKNPLNRLFISWYVIQFHRIFCILIQDHLYLAVGNDLHYYQQIGGDTIHKFQVTKLYDKIHGIESIQKSPTEFHIIVFGGRELVLIQIKDVSTFTLWFHMYVQSPLC